MAKMVSDSSEVVSVVSKDLKEFLQSDSDELPRSLKQLLKIARCEEFTNFVVRVSLALIVGILRGYESENKSEIEEVGGSSFVDMDRMMSTVGTRFVFVVIGSFARNLVLVFYSNSGSDKGLNGNCQFVVPYMKKNSSEVPRWIDGVCTDRFFTSDSSKKTAKGIAYQWRYMVENKPGDPGVAPGSCSSRKELKPLNSRSASLFLMNYFPTVAVQNGACKEHSTQLIDTAAAGYKAAGNMMPNYVEVNFYMVLN
ncbi:putative histone-lysine N-methyltransferase CLF-like [Capsicum annuum]|nr:putative histone-lysine N-methyltransferase CLF-like [Capsicum annuum]KAF3618060.1 putative histone-lysine N-methyltransferase CLF-like [Capsicum annuum]